MMMVVAVIAAVPSSITYQGRLLENGVLVNGSKTMSFGIYDALSDGNALWTTGDQTITVRQGIYSVGLGPIDSTDLTSDTAYLQVTVNGEVLTPRTRLTSVAFALKAGTAVTADYALNAEGGISTENADARYVSQNQNTDVLLGGDIDVAGLVSANSGIFEGTVTASAFSSSSPLRLQTAGVDRIYVNDSTGYVGIGTTSPSKELEVSGSAKVLTGLTIGNDTGTTAGTLRWTGSDFQGYTGSGWSSLVGGSGGATITSVDVPSVAGIGDTITINGSSFVTQNTIYSDKSKVFIDGVEATTWNVINDTLITAVVPTPSDTNDTVHDVLVINGVSGTKADSFPWAVPSVTSISPPTGSIDGGTAITITGTNFRDGATVLVSVNAATSVVFVSDTSLTADTPEHTSTGSVLVKVTNPSGFSGTKADGFTYEGVAGVTDSDGNVYDTVVIGTQTWLATNLKNKGPADCSDVTWVNSSDEGWCGDYTGGPFTDEGLLYQWSAAMNGSTSEGAQGLCPDGYHIPTDADWKTLEGFLGMSGADQDATGWRYTGDVGTDLKEGGSSNFEALLAGYRGTDGSFGGRGSVTNLWSSSESGTNAWRRYLNSNDAGVYRVTNDKANGWSVRCVMD